MQIGKARIMIAKAAMSEHGFILKRKGTA